MKKIALLTLSAVVFLNTFAYALDATLVDIRNEVLKESKEIKSLLPDTKDVILMNTMWDSCVMMMTQLDAYFYMLRIFNTIKRKDITKDAIDSLVNWLNEIKKTNELNIKSLTVLRTISRKIESNTEIHMERLRDCFNNLNNQIDAELKKVSTLQESLKL